MLFWLSWAFCDSNNTNFQKDCYNTYYRLMLFWLSWAFCDSNNTNFQKDCYNKIVIKLLSDCSYQMRTKTQILETKSEFKKTFVLSNR